MGAGARTAHWKLIAGQSDLRRGPDLSWMPAGAGRGLRGRLGRFAKTAPSKAAPQGGGQGRARFHDGPRSSSAAGQPNRLGVQTSRSRRTGARRQLEVHPGPGPGSSYGAAYGRTRREPCGRRIGVFDQSAKGASVFFAGPGPERISVSPPRRVGFRLHAEGAYPASVTRQSSATTPSTPLREKLRK